MIELLVAIAIVAILATLLVPVIGGTKEAGNKVKNASNLRAIGIATLAYGNDHDGLLPLYGALTNPSQTQGVHVMNTSAPPRRLFPTDSPGGGHTEGGGYLESADIFYGPFTSGFTKSGEEFFARNLDGVPAIGYCYYSLPDETTTASGQPRDPYVFDGQKITNGSVSSWGRTPLYSDMPNASTRRPAGFSGNVFQVLHLDGSVSTYPANEVLTASASVANLLYYLSFGKPRS